MFIIAFGVSIVTELFCMLISLSAQILGHSLVYSLMMRSKG